MATTQSRRDFLRGRVQFPKNAFIRPPGSVENFASVCTHCSDCASACPQGIIVRGDSGEPVVDFTRGACTFCQDCARACTTGALVVTGAPGWDWRAVPNESCLSASGIACRACEDVCDTAAIRFRPALGGRAVPQIDLASCTGCGACLHACPAGAIDFTRQPVAAVPA